MLDFGCGAGAREPVLQSWPAELSGFKGPSKVMSEVLRCIKESFRKNLKKYFFREKNFDRNFFRKKKLKKKCALRVEPCKFSESPQRYGCKNGFGGPFFVKKIAKTQTSSVLCCAKNRCLSNFSVLFFCRQTLLQKSREDTSPGNASRKLNSN